MFLEKFYKKNFFYNKNIFFYFLVLLFIIYFYNDLNYNLFLVYIEEYVYLKKNYYIYFLVIYFFAAWLATVLLLPGLILAFFAGLIFGTMNGIVINILSTTCGSITVFYFFRKFSNNFIEKNFFNNNLKITKNIKKNQTSFLVFARLLGFPPIQLLNILPAYTGMSLCRFSLIVFFAQPLIKIYVIALSSGANFNSLETVIMMKNNIYNYLFYLLPVIIFYLLLNKYIKKWILKKIN